MVGNFNSKKNICTPVIALLLFLIAHAVAMGGTLTGKVTDESDGTPLFKATVNLKADDPSFQATGTAADENGEFRFENLPAGTYRIMVSSVGFTTQSFADVTIGDGEPTSLTVQMQPTFINLNAISVTASRRPEKINEAPAAVSVVSSEEIEERSTLTPTEHLKGLPAVDVATTGLHQSSAVVRGFNNIFSGALLVLTDNRIARVPSLRFNAYNFIPTINEDIERIEVVSGPGSALYGPNAASGVMHMITKSPFAYPGTSVSVGGGERNLFLGSVRHAGMIGDKFGYKITGQYYQGDDWKSSEPSEPDSVRLFKPTTTGPEYVGSTFANDRDYDIERFSGEARLEYLFNDDTKLIVNGGLSNASGIELTGLGAAQAVNWTYSYAQMQFNYKDLYMQGFVNMSDAGDTYLLSTGQMIVDKSRLYVGQIQHQYTPLNWLSLTYGLDALFTRPNTESTINGNNENEDGINEVGGYLQADAQVNEQIKIIGAARLDDHNRLENLVFSPRAAITYQPAKDQNFRLTYNRAFSTPDNNNFYLDLLQTNDLAGIGASFEGAFPSPLDYYRPEFDIRVQGVPESGFHFQYSDDGDIMFRSPFNPMAMDEYIELNDPVFTTTMWRFGSGAVLAGIGEQLDMALQGGLIDQATYDALWSSLTNATPLTISGVNNVLMSIDPDQGTFVPSSLNDIADIDPLKPTISNTVELGYNGFLGKHLKFAVDVYRTEKDDFVGPLMVETPNVFLDPTTLQTDLWTQFNSYFSGNPVDSATLAAFFDNPAYGGNGNGTAADELTQIFTEGAAQIPYGTVTPAEAYDPTAILVTYRNFGEVVYYGTDLMLEYRLNQHWSFGGSYSYISKNHFEKDDQNVHDINLNSPRNKFALLARYHNSRWGLTANARFRFVDAFEMDSPFYGDWVDSYDLVDLNVGLDFFYGTHLNLTVQNIFDNKHIEFVGGPELGRLGIMRLTKSF